ncbi:aromatic ring-opening dioxygenase family protein [Aspergillus karnatakaensis]|uniref:DODA-type extradiol aromatic ring-opening family dioxygenase n=1 Tax=Aspergillus karnatakaensis TaxID=1810916 RepID=UPI003CCDA9B4
MEAAQEPTPVLLFSHGTPMMLGEESNSRVAWERLGDEARRRGIKRIVIMGAHWVCGGDGVEVNMNTNGKKCPVGGVSDSRWLPYKLNADIDGGERVMRMLNEAGIKATPNYKWDWIHDTFNVLIRMFPRHIPPPTVVVSLNGFFDPQFHGRVGAALRPLRYEDTLIISTAGTVHNLFRAHWWDPMMHLDNRSQKTPPPDWAMEFRQLFEDAVLRNRGPHLRMALTRQMKHPRYREAHGTDEHYLANVFAGGAAGAEEDLDTNNYKLVEDWEYGNLASTQFQLGDWE